MKNVVCMRHRSYSGEGNPDLSCKTCCEIYIAKIASVSELAQGLRKKDAERWMLTKNQRELDVQNRDQENITFLI